ncbi:transporter substrate-binding domain-containing protein [Desulfotignum phosphitoxidans]|uniref:Sensory box histidine kinase n=1 Tax=Desulfotignum phosphitoxidans DSM 13687 TaxID=1286635 RepID=S0G6A5_9BACT|nr:transporter substrate-binding domain-containing protein [Desulfotignum phosphitoxidans]EMS80227.1 sensory box histidine kinase [Desulfotignum phosphitoxidans DSM 13687]
MPAVSRQIAFIHLFICVILCFLFSQAGLCAVAQDADSLTITLTEQEKAFIEKHPVIRVSNEMDWPPFDFAIGNQPFGLSIDVMTLLGARLGIQFKYINGYRWNELVNMFQKNQLDLLQSAYKSPAREQIGRFTSPYYKDKTVFVVPSHSPGISDITDMSGKIVAIPKGWAYETYLTDHYPDIQVLTVKNTEDAFHAVMNQKADAAIELSAVARYLIKKNYLTGLKISGWFNQYDSNDQKALHIMVRPDWPVLHQMLEKALLTITPGDIAALEYKWLGEIRPGIDRALNLTPEEKAFLATHPKIRVANELDWPPFDFLLNGEPAGFAIDYVRLLAEIVGLDLEFINGYTWSQLLEKGRTKEIDLFPGLWKSPDREEFLAFSRPYIQLIKVLVTQKDAPPVHSLADMKHRKIALPTGYTLTEMVMDQYPDLDYVMVKNPAEGIKRVSLGRADGFVGALGIVNYIIKQQFINNVHVAGEIELDQDLPLHMGVRKDWQILATILDKAMKQVDPLQYDAIVQKWIGSMDPAGELATLTREEKAYLKTKKQISLCVRTDAPPFEFLDSNGEYSGIVADFYQLLSRKIGVPIQVAGNGSEIGTCDMIAVVTPNDPDSADIQPGSAYATYPLVIATDRNALYINTLEAVGEKPIAVSTRASFYPDIQTRYPQVNFIPMDSVEQGLIQVQKGQVFGLVDTAPEIGHYIQENNLFDLKISGELPYQVRFQAGVPTDDPVLFQIVEKAIHSLTPEEKKQVFQNWMTLNYEQKFDYTLLWGILLTLGIIGSFAVYRHISITRYNRKLGRLNQELVQANKKLEAISYLDGLTGIPNRRKFDEVLETEWKRCERNQLTLTLMMIDIDYFKPFNDRYGHLEGDDCLKKVAQTLESLLRRPGDFVARYGGEEFSIILPGIEPAGTENLARKILDQVQALEIPNQDSDVSPYLTVSLGGISAVPTRSLPAHWFINQADQLLYRAKENGRNRYQLETL